MTRTNRGQSTEWENSAPSALAASLTGCGPSAIAA